MNEFGWKVLDRNSGHVYGSGLAIDLTTAWKEASERAAREAFDLSEFCGSPALADCVTVEVVRRAKSRLSA